MNRRVLQVNGEVAIPVSEVELRATRAGGPGGQHVNKTQSAVRITHLPTGVVVQCQNQRSQIMNRKSAMKALASKLHLLEEANRNAELVKALKAPDLSERLLRDGIEPIGNTPEEFRAHTRREREKWGKVVRDANVKVE